MNTTVLIYLIKFLKKLKSIKNDIITIIKQLVLLEEPADIEL